MTSATMIANETLIAEASRPGPAFAAQPPGDAAGRREPVGTSVRLGAGPVVGTYRAAPRLARSPGRTCSTRYSSGIAQASPAIRANVLRATGAAMIEGTIATCGAAFGLSLTYSLMPSATIIEALRRGARRGCGRWWRCDWGRWLAHSPGRWPDSPARAWLCRTRTAGCCSAWRDQPSSCCSRGGRSSRRDNRRRRRWSGRMARRRASRCVAGNLEPSGGNLLAGRQRLALRQLLGGAAGRDDRCVRYRLHRCQSALHGRLRRGGWLGAGRGRRAVRAGGPPALRCAAGMVRAASTGRSDIGAFCRAGLDQAPNATVPMSAPALSSS